MGILLACMFALHVPGCASRDQKKALDILEPEFQVFVNHLMGAGSSATRAASARNC